MTTIRTTARELLYIFETRLRIIEAFKFSPTPASISNGTKRIVAAASQMDPSALINIERNGQKFIYIDDSDGNVLAEIDWGPLPDGYSADGYPL